MLTRIAFVALTAAFLIAAPSAQAQRRSQEADNSGILSERAAQAAEAGLYAAAEKLSSAQSRSANERTAEATPSSR